MARLSRAGFTQHFVATAILPDWWDASCAADPQLLPEVELRVARFLGAPLEIVADPSVALTVAAPDSARLRRIHAVDRDRLQPAIHAATRVAGAVVRCLRHPETEDAPIPPDGADWRDGIGRDGSAVTLEHILGDLWKRGVAVVPVEVSPKPSFQGMACIVDGRRVIVLPQAWDEPGRVAFLLAHEAGHHAAGDCSPDAPVVDEVASGDGSAIEARADAFATRVIAGRHGIPHLAGGPPRALAQQARTLERERGVEATAMLCQWARQTGDYRAAQSAAKALGRASGARQTLRAFFDRHVDVDEASDSDRALLRCVFGDADRHEAAG